MNILELISPVFLVAPQLDGTIILTIGLVTIAAGIVGLFTPYKVFLIISCGGYITLLVEFQDYPAIVLGLIGVIMFNIWYAFWGGQ